MVDEPKAVIEAKVVDSATGERTPARVHFRTLDGRYIPPYGHRHEVNDAWFEDYGADLILGDTAYAYVDGKFEIELPVGDVLVEVVKGFEYTPTRSRVSIAPGQTHLALEIGRAVDLRAAGWVSADTHVHFVSPETAWLMGQAEGVNVVNLLAAQWGELFTNIADYTGDLSSVSRRDTLVWVGTENRQHLLGHLSLLGKRGSMAEPLSAAGPNESYLGDPLWTGMGGWADTCRAAGGLSVIPHFPNPDGEVAAECILGKIDGVELRDFRHGIDSYAVRTWYRYLNSGVRIPAMGGTDKMSAGMPIGGVRTYAFIGERELTFEAWADAVRHGRTVTTSGPLLELEVEGQPIGSEIRLPTGGGKVDVRATAFCLQGIGHVELVQDGMVVARKEAPEGAVRVVIETSIDVKQPGWIAARSEGPAVVWHCWPVRMAAHTSPVYVAVGDRDRPPISSGDRAYFATLLEGGMTWLDELGTPVDEQRRRRIRSAFEEAAERLADRDHRTGRRA
ncbi:MAG: CehA/McbA family metallohydrolase [Actinomycetota bacterium]|nr:CehA/McbA family metallohydrolase [Actinomycetota bacterium]